MGKTPAAPSCETLVTPGGVIEYRLTRKRVRNLNLRVLPDGSLAASAPPRMPKREIEAFITQKSAWIIRSRARLENRPAPQPPRYTPEQCLARFTAISDGIFPLFSTLLDGQKPQLRVREMKSRWGVCHTKKRSITLNTRLAEKPLPAQEYVILHEYVHFLHPNHQQGFHTEMARLMPDYRARRKLLK